MITMLRLKNWKSHLDSEFDFSSGVNAFIGQMGSGKTSVMDAISFALYGTFPTHQSRKVGLDDLIMKKPQKKSQAQIELEFQMDGKKYYVKRVIEAKRGTTQAEIREDSRLLDVNAASVTREVERALQMDYDLFSRAVYSEQNSLDYFLRIPKGQRMNHIDRMLKVDRFEAVREDTIRLKNRIKQEMKGKMDAISNLEKEDLNGKIEKAKGEMNELVKDKEKIREEADRVKKERNELSERVAVFKEKEERLNELKSELKGIETGLKETEENLKQKENRLKGKSMESISREMMEMEKEMEKIRKDLERKKKELEMGREKIAGFNAEIKLILDSLNELEKIKGKCPVCDSDVTPEKRRDIIEKKKLREKELREKANAVASELEILSRDKDGLETSARNKEIEKEKIKTFLDDVKDVEELRKKERDYVRKKEILEKDKETVEKELAEVRMSELMERLQEKIAKESELVAKMSGIEERVRDKEEVLEDLNRRKQTLEDYKKGIKQDENIMEQLEEFTKALKITQDQLREEFLKTVNFIMNDVWGELYPYEDFEGIRLVIDGDYVLQLKEPGGWVSVEGFVSGGERSMACLALRIAFSMAFIPNLKWLILDEPTHNLDSNAIQQLATVLREKMNMFAEQVFLITHEERISEGVTGRLYRLERDKEANGPTRIASG